MGNHTSLFGLKLAFKILLLFQPARYVLEVVKKIRSRYANVNFI